MILSGVSINNLAQRLVGRVLPVVGRVKQPLVVADGMGVDSSALLIFLARMYHAGYEECRPDLILFANTGGSKNNSEWPETYDYYERVRRPWLKKVGFPDCIMVQYEPERATYDNLFDNCCQNATYPGITFNIKNCSDKFKIQPQNKFCNNWQPARSIWALGGKCIKIIGYDAGPKDMRRPSIKDDDKYIYWYTLRELGWDREKCIEEIRKEGLPGWEHERFGKWLEKGGIPVKSACTFCSSMKPHELEILCERHPERALGIISLEAAAAPYYDSSKVAGLWRLGTKGKKPGSVAKPGSMTEYIISLSVFTPEQVEEAQERGRATVKEEVKARRSLFVLPNGGDEDDDGPCY